MQACKHFNNAVRCPMSSQAEKTECVRYVAGFFSLATPRISAIPSHMLTSLHPARHIPPTLAPLRPASHPLRRVPVRLCEINVRMYAGRPYIRYLPPIEVGKIAARGYMYRSSRWGAPRLRASALSSRPACAPSPLAGRNLPLLFNAPAARPRPNALTLIPPGFVLPLVALAPPRFSTARATLLPRFPSLAGLATLAPTQTHSRPLVGSATLRPRHASPRAGNMKRVGVEDDSGVQPKKTTRRR